MSQSVITSQFEKFKAQEAAGGRRLILNQFVFANVPDLDLSAPPAKDSALPPEAQIVWKQGIDAAAMINENAVTYTVTLDERAGDFIFNWLGLLTSDGVLAMVMIMPPQRKIMTKGGNQGNVLTYGALMEYEGASAATGITTLPETWQIDFSARLHGMDELTRTNALDIYGEAVFFHDAFLVKLNEGSGSPASATITPGTAYIRGLRITAPKPINVVFPRVSGFTMCLDVTMTGTITGEHKIEYTVINQEKPDYTDSTGNRHHVQPLARLTESGVLKDLRTVGRPIREFHEDLNETETKITKKMEDFAAKLKLAQEEPTYFLTIANNLQEIGDSGETAKKAARNNIGAAASNDTRINNALDKNQNLADLINVTTARQNLQLGDMAEQNRNNVNITGGNVNDVNLIGENIAAKNFWIINNRDGATNYSFIDDNGDIKGAAWKEFYKSLEIPEPTTNITSPAFMGGTPSALNQYQLSSVIGKLVDINKGGGAMGGDDNNGWAKVGGLIFQWGSGSHLKNVKAGYNIGVFTKLSYERRYIQVMYSYSIPFPKKCIFFSYTGNTLVFVYTYIFKDMFYLVPSVLYIEAGLEKTTDILKRNIIKVKDEPREDVFSNSFQALYGLHNIVGYYDANANEKYHALISELSWLAIGY